MDDHSDIAFKSEFNSPAKVLALWAMKINVSLVANCLTVNTKWFDQLLMQIRENRGHEIDPCGAPKKAKQNIYIFNLDSLYARANSYYKVWS